MFMETTYRTQNIFEDVRIIASDLDGTLYPLNLARKVLSGAYHQCSHAMPQVAASVRRYFPHLSIPLRLFNHPKNKEYYQRAMEKTGLDPDAHISVGDNVESDIRPSKDWA